MFSFMCTPPPLLQQGALRHRGTLSQFSSMLQVLSLDLLLACVFNQLLLVEMVLVAACKKDEIAQDGKHFEERARG